MEKHKGNIAAVDAGTSGTAAFLGRLLLRASLAFGVGASLPSAHALAPQALQDQLDRAPSPRSAVEASLLAEMRAFYARRDYRPLWLEGERLAHHGRALIVVLARAGEHGLDPGRYRVQGLPEDGRALAGKLQGEIELALTRAYFNYAVDIVSGAVDDRQRVGRVFREAKPPAPSGLLDGIASAADPFAFLDRLPPDLRHYNALKSALARYREIARGGGWPRVGQGPPLKPGMRGDRVAEVKRRLLASGDLTDVGNAETYDEALVAAVRKFQLRHGLAEDGNVGADTISEMNVGVRDRIAQIIINLERRRWLSPHLGERYIYLNIADNDLKLVERGHTIHVARVIVGQPYQQTPVFSAVMNQIEINPYWNVPRSIAVNELLPIIRKNPAYLPANDYLLLARGGDNGSAVNPTAVTWTAITAQNFPYAIRQLPGAKNALGTMAFRFPNAHNVYLHDTPSKNLFNRESRYFSHGCMRVEFPLKLALLLLAAQDTGAWNEQRIRSLIETRRQTFIDLKMPIPVHITYLTAWADQDGTVQFRRDAYGRDPALMKAMKRLVRME